MDAFDEHLNAALEDIRAQGLWRELWTVDSDSGREVVIDGQPLLNFCGNDYLGLRHEPALKEAVQKGLADGLPLGSGASRLVTGNHAWHERVEAALAAFKGQRLARLFSSGYLANLGLVQALMDGGGTVFSDRRNHASLIDAARLCRAGVQVFPHNDVTALEEQLEAAPPGPRLVAVESVYSMDGDPAPLSDIAQVCGNHGALLVVDEAHATGVFGPGGRGLVAALEADVPLPCPVAVMGTLSKAFGLLGGYVAGSDALIETLTQKARSLIYDTSLPVMLMPAVLAALAWMKDHPAEGERLLHRATALRQRVQALGYDTGQSASQIIPLIVGENDTTMGLANNLLEAGVLARGIRYPSVPKGAARIRLTLSRLNTDEDVDRLVTALEQASPHHRDR